MAIPYKFYTNSTNGRQYVEILPGTNTPYGSSETDFAGALNILKQGYEQDVANFQDALNRGVVGPANQSAYNAQNYTGKISAIDQAISKYKSGQLTGQDLLNLPLDNSNPFRNLSAQDLQTMIGGGNVSSGYTTYTNPQTGQQDFITEKSLAELEADKAKANDPNYIPVQVGTGTAYVPKGSAGAALIPSLGQNVTEGATPGSIVQNPSVGAAPQGGTTVAQNQQQATSYTAPQFTNNNNQVYKEWNEGAQNWDVKTTDGKAVSLEQFKNMGLNIDHINTKQKLQDQINSGANINSGTDGGSGTAKSSSDFVSDYTSIIKELGLTDIKDRMKEIETQEAELDKKMSEEIMAVQDNPWYSQGLLEKKTSLIKSKYETQKSALTDRLNLFNSIYEEGMAEAKFLTSGVQEDRNKLLQIAQDKAEAMSKLDTSIVEHDGNKYLVDMQTGEEMLLGRSSTGTTTGSTTTNYAKGLQGAIDDIYSGNYGTTGAREKAIAKLKSLFPGVDVAKDIYSRVADGYEGSVTSGSVSVNKSIRLQQLLLKSDSGQNLDKLTQEEQAELYSLL